jgi:hypothetical protein
MTLPPDRILDAALLVLHRALVYTRNITLHPNASASQQVNEISEALHEIPDFLAHWDKHDIDEMRRHLRCFDHTRWVGAPNLVQMFDNRLLETNL